MMTLPLIAAALAAQTPDTVAGRPCKVVIDSVGNYGRQIEEAGGTLNFFAGGGVRAHCQGTESKLAADSVAYYAALHRFDLVGNVRLRDATLALDATNASYFLHQERLEAHRNVVAVNQRTGSVLRGPNLTYLRATTGVRDTTEVYATSRPTIDFRAEGDTGEPYVVVGDRVRMRGDDRMWAGGRVTVDRHDMSAHADSMTLDQTAGWGALVGRPWVEGKSDRPYTLRGRRIELALAQHEVRQVLALGSGEATGSEWRLTADTIQLGVEDRKLQQTLAWGDSSRPRAVSRTHTVEGDSLALDTPGEVLRELRAFGHALSTSRPDTVAEPAELDWMTGDTLVARFTAVPDSTGRSRSELSQLDARGSARSLTHLAQERGRPGGPSINYSRGTSIAVTLRGDQVDRVVVGGHADGVHLEPLPPPPADSSGAADSTAARAP